jgi:TonB family protein
VGDATTLIENISIPWDGFSPDNLVCLATRLRERYRDRSHILIYIFSSHETSKYSIMVGELDEGVFRTFKQIHALYVLDADADYAYLKILPAGVLPPHTASTEGPYSTQIDLPVSGTPHCYLEINARCLIVLEDPRYPFEAFKRRGSGTVTLAGTITRSGKVSQVRVTKKESAPEGEEDVRDLMAAAAVSNLSTWRLEPGPHAEAIQITYSYVIDHSLPRGVSGQVQWALPNGVEISTSPAQ